MTKETWQIPLQSGIRQPGRAEANALQGSARWNAGFRRRIEFRFHEELAVRVGFEPTIELPLYTRSRRAP